MVDVARRGRVNVSDPESHVPLSVFDQVTGANQPVGSLDVDVPIDTDVRSSSEAEHLRQRRVIVDRSRTGEGDLLPHAVKERCGCPIAQNDGA
jgi:hypothetical protein